MSFIAAILNRFGYVKLARYGLSVGPDGQVRTIGTHGALPAAAWQSHDGRPLPLSPEWGGIADWAPPPPAPVSFAPNAPRSRRPSALRRPGSASETAPTNLLRGHVEPAAASVSPDVEAAAAPSSSAAPRTPEDEEWEWNLALARARAAAEHAAGACGEAGDDLSGATSVREDAGTRVDGPDEVPTTVAASTGLRNQPADAQGEEERQWQLALARARARSTDNAVPAPPARRAAGSVGTPARQRIARGSAPPPTPAAARRASRQTSAPRSAPPARSAQRRSRAHIRVLPSRPDDAEQSPHTEVTRVVPRSTGSAASTRVVARSAVSRSSQRPQPNRSAPAGADAASRALAAARSSAARPRPRAQAASDVAPLPRLTSRFASA